WRPADGLLVSLDDNYSRDTLHARQYGYSVWFNSTSLRDVVLSTDKTITDFEQPNSPTDFQSQINGSVIQNNDVGINVTWTESDRLIVNFDLDDSQGALNPGGQLSTLDADVGYGASTAGGINSSNLSIVVPGGHNLPYPVGYGPNGNGAAFIDNGLIGSHVLPLVSNQRFDRVQQARLEATWTQNANSRLTTGYQYVGDHRTGRSSNDFVNNDWQAYAGYGPASNNLGTHGAALPQSLFTQSFSTKDFIQGFGGGGLLPARILAFDGRTELAYLQGLGNPQIQAIPGFNTGCCTPPFDGAYSLATVPAADAQTVENTHAAYLAFFTRTMIDDMPLKINAGLRAESTEVTSIGLGQNP
ncbi:MAG TPA: hypothetical protein VIK18_10295, partial [Pirellulales bacterium]